MALLKAFVCQVMLLGLYKVFLEKVVEEHLVPDELTRNCLVGFVCLLCFGIQLYTDKAGDDEAEEDPKMKSTSKESTGAQQKFEQAEISVTHETVTKIVGLNESCHVINAKTQTTSLTVDTKTEQSSKNQVVCSKEVSKAAAEKMDGNNSSHKGIFAEFSKDVPDRVDMDASNYQASYEEHEESIPVLNGISEVNICEESDEEGIEIDQFVSKDARDLRSQQDEDIELEDSSRAVLESESSTTSLPDLDSTLKNDESQSVINGRVDESINKMSSNVMGEIQSTKLGTEENKVGDKIDMSPRKAPESHECSKDIDESLSCSRETYCANSESTKVAKELNISNKSNTETSTSQSVTALSSRRKILSQNVVITSVDIDISFLYAFY